jgi:hypothetical protein
VVSTPQISFGNRQGFLFGDQLLSSRLRSVQIREFEVRAIAERSQSGPQRPPGLARQLLGKDLRPTGMRSIRRVTTIFFRRC